MDLSNDRYNGVDRVVEGNRLVAKIPHALVLEKDSNSDYKSYYRSKLNEWRDVTKAQALAFYRSGPEYNQVQKYINALQNERDKRRPIYKSDYRNNKMGLARKDRLAKMGDARPTVDVDTTVDAYKDAAFTIEGTIRAEWVRQNMGDELVRLYDMAMLNGTAFWKTGITNGHLSLNTYGPDQVIPIQPSLRSMQDSACVLHLAQKPMSYFQKVFPQSCNGIQESISSFNVMANRYNKPDNMDQVTWDGFSPSMQRMMGQTNPFGSALTSGKYYGSAQLEEYYIDDISINESKNVVVMKDPFLPLDGHNWHYEVAPGERLYPRKRLVIYGGNKLLYDGPSPFWHGQYPFVCLRINPVPWHFYGLSIYRDLLPLQEYINEIPAGIMDAVRKALNPPILSRTNAVSPSMFNAFTQDLPGARLLLNPGADPKEAFHWQDPPQLPAYVGEILQGVLNPEFDKQAGNVDVVGLSTKNQVPGGETIDQMRDSLQTHMRREERYLETAMNEGGYQSVSNTIQFYTVKQRMQLLGEDGVTKQDFLSDPGKLHDGKQAHGAYFHKMFALSVTPGSLHGAAKDRKVMEGIGLAARGLISRKELYRRMGLDPGDSERIINELIEEAQFMAQLNSGGMMGGGAGGSRTPRSPEQKNNGV